MFLNNLVVMCEYHLYLGDADNPNQLPCIDRVSMVLNIKDATYHSYNIISIHGGGQTLFVDIQVYTKLVYHLITNTKAARRSPQVLSV